MLLKRYQKNFNIYEVVSSLKSDGILILDSYFDDDFIDKLKKEYDLILNQKDDPNDKSIYTHVNKDFMFAKAVSLKKPNQIHKFGCLKEITEDKNFYLLNSQYFKKKFYYQKFFLVNTKYSHDKNEYLNKKNTYIPHTDELHFLKFFIYLQDTNEDNGCFFALPKSQAENKKIRKKWISEGKHRNLRDKEVYQRTEQLLPVIAKKGSVIVFDTDVTHKAGKIKSEKFTRNIVRLDSFCPHENYELKYQRATIKVKKIYSSLLRSLNI